MAEKTIFCIFILLTISAAFAAMRDEGNILRDGLTLAGVDGQLKTQDNNSVYYFKTDTEITDDRTVLKAGTSIELLPSVSLEKMAAIKEQNPSTGFRIWGRVTSYEGKNYIFVIYFLQTGRPETANTGSQADSSLSFSQTESVVEDPNDTLKLPKEILEKMKSPKIIQPAQLAKGLEMEQDSILVDRTGFIKNDPNGNLILVFDSFGRNIENVSITLLPCYLLENCRQVQQEELEGIRFNVSGIVTKFRGDFYLLLQRAGRVYSHGNFTR